jgi:CheY-like chemotaxis protein
VIRRSAVTGTVLVAEDDDTARELLCTALRRAGHQVLAAADGDEAWELLRRHRPRVAVLDVQMPGRTGLEVVAALRADPELRDTYVLMLTGERREQDLRAGQAAGANRYLLKPFSMLGLTQAVAQGFDMTDTPPPPQNPLEW